MTRHQMRQSALSLSFAAMFGDRTIEEICAAAKEMESEEESVPVSRDSQEMAANIIAKAPILDEKIEPYLKEWSLDRLPKLTLAILRLAFYEILYTPEIQPPIVINEAVELAKEYTTEKDAKFINGVLGNLIKE